MAESSIFLGSLSSLVPAQWAILSSTHSNRYLILKPNNDLYACLDQSDQEGTVKTAAEIGELILQRTQPNPPPLKPYLGELLPISLGYFEKREINEIVHQIDQAAIRIASVTMRKEKRPLEDQRTAVIAKIFALIQRFIYGKLISKGLKVRWSFGQEESGVYQFRDSLIETFSSVEHQLSVCLKPLMHSFQEIQGGENQLLRQVHSYLQEIPGLIYAVCKMCKTQGIEISALTVTAGDSHSGYRPAIIVTLKGNESQKKVFKFRDMTLDRLILDPREGLFAQINALLPKATLPTRAVQTFEDHKFGSFGIEDFVLGGQIPKDRLQNNGHLEVFHPFLDHLFSSLEAVYRYILLYRTTELAGIGKDAHFHNFIIDEEKGECIPIDFEVYQEDATHTEMQSIESIFRIYQDKSLKEVPQFEEIRGWIARASSEIESFFSQEEVKEIIRNFKKTVQDHPNLFVRVVVVDTGTISQMLDAQSSENFALSMVSDMKVFCEKHNYVYKSEAEGDIMKHLREEFEKCSYPLFLSDVRNQSLWYHGLEIARRAT